MNERLLWIDIETTGLFADRGLPLEIAVALTDERLSTIFEAQRIICWEPDVRESIKRETAIVARRMHEESGLWEAVMRGDGQSLELAERELVHALLHADPENDYWRPPMLAGSKPLFDRQWLGTHFPTLARLPHYRDFDLNAVRQLLRLSKGWGREGRGRRAHRALDDLREDIETLHKVVNLLEAQDVFQAFAIPEPETTDSIYAWGRETFGDVPNVCRYVGRALEEFTELVELLEYPPSHISDGVKEKDLAYLASLAKVLKIAELPADRREAAAEEIADVRIVLEHVNGALGFDGQGEVDRKMGINRRRTWPEPDGQGISQHLTDPRD